MSNKQVSPISEKNLVAETRELFANEPPWTIETHDARGDYVKIALVRRAPSFTCGYYVIADDDMESRREQSMADYAKFIKARILLSALANQVDQLRSQVQVQEENITEFQREQKAFRSMIKHALVYIETDPVLDDEGIRIISGLRSALTPKGEVS